MNCFKLTFLIFFLLFLCFLPSLHVAHAQTITPPPQAVPQETFSKAKVIRIISEGEKTIADQKNYYQKVELRILEGSEKEKTLTFTHGERTTLRETQKVQVGQTVVLRKAVTSQTTTYQIADIYRLDQLYPILFFFVALVLFIGRWKGLGALVGLGISLFIITLFIVPTILAGEDPLLTSLVGSLLIMIITMYVAHGFTQKTHISLLATCIALLITGFLAYLFVQLTSLTGLGSEDATSLQFGATGSINFRGLLLGGIIIGSLGVLDDVTTSLTASIQEVAKANAQLPFRSLFSSGLRIGRDHIASLINTLALAYAGAGLPLFLFLILNPTNQPLWLLFNSELITEEIIRTLAGSTGLILAVPLTALFAAWSYQKKS